MTDSDAALVARVRLGDTAAFEILVRRHFRSAYLVALAHVGDGGRADAEDICQEGLLRAWERIHECRDPSRFSAWFTRIVRNAAINRREYLAVRAATPIDHSTAAAAERADHRVEQEELRARIDNALAQLTSTQREVVLLHDLEGWTHGAVADAIGVSELMSRRHLSDARKKLRALLRDYVTMMPDHD
jgi:RNA polymerase sigma-70 factor (ECF subfamily)